MTDEAEGVKGNPAAPAEPRELAEAREESLLSEIIAKSTLDRISAMTGSRAAEVVQNRITTLETIRKAALRATQPTDWTLYKGEKTVAVLTKSGAERVRPFYAIVAIPYVPAGGDGTGVTIEKDETGKRVASIVGSGFCGITEQRIDGIGSKISEEEEFRGRTERVGAKLSTQLGDLRQSTRSRFDTKITRILAAMSKVDPEELARAWGKEVAFVLENCNRGSGFGSSGKREGKDVGDQKPGCITTAQVSRAWGKASTRAAALKLDKKVVMRGALDMCGYDGKEITDVPFGEEYDSICRCIDQWEPPAAVAATA